MMILQSALVVVSLLLLVCVTRWMLRNRNVSNQVPPGSSGLPLIGETLQFMASIYSGRGFYDFVHSRHLRYGKCFRTNILGATHVFVSSTEAAKMILNNESGGFTKKYIKSIGELMGGHSILCAKSDQHHKLIRARLACLFSTASLSLFTRQFDHLVSKSINAWQHTDVVVILDEASKAYFMGESKVLSSSFCHYCEYECHVLFSPKQTECVRELANCNTDKMTFKAMCKILMSLEDGEEVDTLQKDVALVCEAMLALPLTLPGTRFQRGIEARTRIMTTLDTIIDDRRRRRRRTQTRRQDFLQHLLTVKETPLIDDEIKDNILTMIIAGQDTTASAITWMVKYLGENQEVRDSLLHEQLRIAKGSILELEDLGAMPYASKVVKESLRMASVVPWFPRLVLEDSQIEGYQMKKGWTINVDAKSIHLDPMLHNHPHQFNPSRFDSQKEAMPYNFLAFGMGGRTCLGMKMARAMMLVFLHRLVTTYKWEVIDSDSSLEKWAMFSRLKNGCPVRVTRLPAILP